MSRNLREQLAVIKQWDHDQLAKQSVARGLEKIPRCPELRRARRSKFDAYHQTFTANRFDQLVAMRHRLERAQQPVAHLRRFLDQSFGHDHFQRRKAGGPQWLAGVGLNANRDIAGLVGVSGPYDFSPLEDATLADIFGGAVLPTTQPISFTQGRKPPALLLTGAADDLVDPANSARLAEKLRSSGNEATDVIYRSQGHMTVLAGFVPMLANFFPTLRDVNAFVERVKPVAAERVSVSAEPP